MATKLDGKELDALLQIPLFSGLTRDDIGQLLAFSPIRRYRTRTILMEKGDAANAFYVLLEGRVRIYAEGDDGKQVTLYELSNGEYFGELALIDDTTRSASAATTADSRLMVISKPDFMNFLSSSPQVAMRIIHYLSEKVRQLTRDVERLALCDVYGRLVDVLNQRAAVEDGRKITGPLTQQELANLVGSSREMVSRIFKELKNGDYISMEGKRIVLNRDLPNRW